MDLFESIPDELIVEIALTLTLKDISYLCQSNSRFNAIICENENFWHRKLAPDYQIEPYFREDWRSFYKNLERVWTFGNNRVGQLGLGDDKNRNVPTEIVGMTALQVSAGYDHTAVIDIMNDVWTFGHDENGQLGIDNVYYKYFVSPMRIYDIKARQVSAGRGFTLLIDIRNEVRASKAGIR